MIVVKRQRNQNEILNIQKNFKYSTQVVHKSHKSNLNHLFHLRNLFVVVFCRFDNFKFFERASILIENTLDQISLQRAVFVCNETAQVSGSVGGAGEWTHTCTLVTYLLCPLALSIPTYSNFQINGASGETFFQKISTFIVVKIASKTIKISPEPPFIWKLL